MFHVFCSKCDTFLYGLAINVCDNKCYCGKCKNYIKTLTEEELDWLYKERTFFLD